MIPMWRTDRGGAESSLGGDRGLSSRSKTMRDRSGHRFGGLAGAVAVLCTAVLGSLSWGAEPGEAPSRSSSSRGEAEFIDASIRQAWEKAHLSPSRVASDE